MFIKLSGFSDDPNVSPVAQHPWPEGTFLQGGSRGIVFQRDGGSYTTAFVEAFPPETDPASGFYRGEGENIAAAETAAWEKYQRASACPQHDWDARGYQNGAAFCRRCNKFGTKIFTGEDLGQYCQTCGIGTTWGKAPVPTAENPYADSLPYPQRTEQAVWWCQEHHPKYSYDRENSMEPTEEEFAEALIAVLNALSQNEENKNTVDDEKQVP